MATTFPSLPPSGGGARTETVLHTFSDTGSDGNLPLNSGVIFGKGGAFYGATGFGSTGRLRSTPR